MTTEPTTDKTTEMATVPKEEEKPQEFGLIPKDIMIAEKLAEKLAKTNFIPLAYRGKPNDVLACVMHGAEVGLAPMQALQNIAVINGRPSVWGDGSLALAQKHPAYVGHEERSIAEIRKTGEAICKFFRRGTDGVIRTYTGTFSLVDAAEADLVHVNEHGKVTKTGKGKEHTWGKYWPRMLQMRARGFSIRDGFSDALKGLIMREEAYDYRPLKEAEYVEVPMPKSTDDVNQDGEKVNKITPHVHEAKETPRKSYGIVNEPDPPGMSEEANSDADPESTTKFELNGVTYETAGIERNTLLAVWDTAKSFDKQFGKGEAKAFMTEIHGVTSTKSLTDEKGQDLCIKMDSKIQEAVDANI